MTRLAHLKRKINPQEDLKEFNNLGAKNYVRYEKRRWQEDNEGHEWHEKEEKASQKETYKANGLLI